VKRGGFFSEDDTRALAQVAVIDETTRRKLFAQGEDSIGRVVFVGRMPVRVIGVAQSNGNVFAASQNINVWVPYTAVLARMLGPAPIRSITARISDSAPMGTVADSVTQLLTVRHGSKDFFLVNTDTVGGRSSPARRP